MSSRGGRYLSIKTGKVVLPAKVIGLDPQNDLALLQVDVKYLPLLKVEGKLAALPLEQDLRKVALGDKVFTVGFPLTDTQGLNPKLTEGSISSLSGIKDHSGELQISVPIQPGNSGGPLVNEYGNVVGIVVSTLNAEKLLRERGIIPQNVNYAVKSSLANLFLESLPKVVNKLKDPNPRAKPRKRSDVIKEVKAATVLILVRHLLKLDPLIERKVRLRRTGTSTGELTKADLEKMTELRLISKLLTEVPRGLENLTKLKRLYLQYNQLTSVRGLEKLNQLQELHLTNNPALTKAQIDQLQKALPNCDIRSNPTK
jgi:Leucine-rich repeat (LRR) protein